MPSLEAEVYLGFVSFVSSMKVDEGIVNRLASRAKGRGALKPPDAPQVFIVLVGKLISATNILQLMFTYVNL